MNIKTTIFALFATYAVLGNIPVLAAATAAQERYAPCLSYYTVGDSDGCQPEQEEAPVSAAPSPTAVAPEPEEPAETGPRPLKERIDEYLADHGKPPREYVSFYLEPTIENAIKWVHTYNEILERNKRITYAWGQAEQIYDTAKAAGADTSQLDNPEDGAVVDFGVAVEGYTRPEGLPQPGEENNLGPQPLGPTQNTVIGGITVPQPPSRAPGLGNLADLNPNIPLPAGTNGDILPPPAAAFAAAARQPAPRKKVESIGGAAPTEITYYFSADCPFCQKFEPGFNDLIADMGSSVDVTCVDMTPTGARQSNINGKVNCAWRPPGLGEISRLGITKTPSVTIQRPGGGALERVVGYVEPSRLRTYLNTGEVQ